MVADSCSERLTVNRFQINATSCTKNPILLDLGLPLANSALCLEQKFSCVPLVKPAKSFHYWASLIYLWTTLRVKIETVSSVLQPVIPRYSHPKLFHNGYNYIMLQWIGVEWLDLVISQRLWVVKLLESIIKSAFCLCLRFLEVSSSVKLLKLVTRKGLVPLQSGWGQNVFRSMGTFTIFNVLPKDKENNIKMYSFYVWRRLQAQWAREPRVDPEPRVLTSHAQFLPNRSNASKPLLSNCSKVFQSEKPNSYARLDFMY